MVDAVESKSRARRLALLAQRKVAGACCLIAATIYGLSYPPLGACFDETGGKDSNVREEISIGIHPRILAVPVSIYGRDYLLQLDTGSTHTKFKARMKRLVGAERGSVDVVTAAGSKRRRAFDAPPMWLGGSILLRGERVCIEGAEEVNDKTTAGILGMDALQRLVLSIDFDGGTLRLLKSADASLGTPVPFRRLQSVPLVRASINGESPQQFIVDTGGKMEGTGLLAAPIFDRLAANGAVKNMRSCTLGTASGSAPSSGGRLASLELAGHRHAAPLFMRSRVNALTLSYWSRYVVTFDFPKNVLYLKPGEDFSIRDSYDLSGLTLEKLARDVVVKAVANGSPADRAGLMIGDKVLTIDGVDTDRIPLRVLRRRFHAEDAEIRLLVRRKSKRLEISLRTTTEAHIAEVNPPPREPGARAAAPWDDGEGSALRDPPDGIIIINFDGFSFSHHYRRQRLYLTRAKAAG